MLDTVLANLSEMWHAYLLLLTLGGMICGFVSWLQSTYIKISNCYVAIEKISKEFKNNGGSSIKDLLDRIEDKIDKIEFITNTYWNKVDIPIFIADNNGKFVWANLSCLTLLGLSLPEIVGTGWESIIATIDREFVVKEWYRACNESRPFNMKFKISIDGVEHLVRCESVGKPELGYIGFFTEIKEHTGEFE